MLKANPQPKQDAQEMAKGTKAVPSIRPASVGNLLPGLLRIYLPSYSPHDVEISPGIQVLADKYTIMAIKTS
jgi:hypothetical protein